MFNVLPTDDSGVIGSGHGPLKVICDHLHGKEDECIEEDLDIEWQALLRSLLRHSMYAEYKKLYMKSLVKFWSWFRKHD